MQFKTTGTRKRASKAIGLALMMLALATWTSARQELNLRSESAAAVFERHAAALPALMNAAELPGLSVVVVDRSGVVWESGFGVRERGRELPITTRTLFSMQSISKAVTAIAVMMAVRDGLVELDEPITTYLPNFTVQSRFNKHPERRITLRHLLSHRSGLAQEAPVGNNFDVRSPSFEAHVASISETWLRFPVGERFAYSNLGVDLAGFVVQTVREQPFADWMQEQVLLPMGMQTATYKPSAVLASTNLAIGYDKEFDALPVIVPMLPAGGLFASGEDLAAFLIFQLNHGLVGEERLLSAEQLAEMRMTSFPPGQQEGYALCVNIRRTHGELAFRHGAGGFGFLHELRWYPDYEFGFVILTNSMHQNLVWEFADELGAELIATGGPRQLSPHSPTPTPPGRARPATDDERAQLAGTYINSESEVVLAGENGELTLSLDNTPPIAFELLSNELGVVKPGGEAVLIRILCDAANRPIGLVRVIDGSSYSRNDGASGAPGPNRVEWKQHVGTWAFPRHGVQAGQFEVHIQNGQLLLDDQRLLEHRPGLFFTPLGFALDLRGDKKTWQSVEIQRT